MKRPFIIGVMGGASVNTIEYDEAYQLGAQIAQRGWVLLNGGRNQGIMAASAKGASDFGGLTIGILPGDSPEQAAEGIQIPICTGMGSGRNIINVLSSDIVIACPGGLGTLSEIALALKHNRRVITLHLDILDLFSPFEKSGLLSKADSVSDVIAQIEVVLTR